MTCRIQSAIKAGEGERWEMDLWLLTTFAGPLPARRATLVDPAVALRVE